MGDEPLATLRLRAGHYASTFIMKVLFVALSWVLLFQLNNYLFSGISVSNLVCWIFLPAFIRMLAVMIFEFAGALGLVLGAYISRDLTLAHSLTPIVLALISGIGPYLSMKLCQRSFSLPESFDGLRPQHLFIFAIAGGVVNAGLNHVYYHIAKIDYSVTNTLIPMMIGDFIGTLLMLYLAALIISALRYYFQSPQSK